MLDVEVFTVRKSDIEAYEMEGILKQFVPLNKLDYPSYKKLDTYTNITVTFGFLNDTVISMYTQFVIETFMTTVHRYYLTMDKDEAIQTLQYVLANGGNETWNSIVSQLSYCTFLPRLFDDYVVTLSDMGSDSEQIRFLTRWLSDNVYSLVVYYKKNDIVKKLAVSYIMDTSKFEIVHSTELLSTQCITDANTFSSVMMPYFAICVQAITYFMLHQKDIEIEQKKANKDKSGSGSDVIVAKNIGIATSSTITVKSKRKQYILSEEDLKSRRAYNFVKDAWIVRGYFQRFGKAKTWKYIKPSIRHRSDRAKKHTTYNTYNITE